MTEDLLKYKKNILKVFKFYSIQHALLGKSPTFESIEKNINTLSKGKFIKFCIDFFTPISQEQIISVFNKVSEYSKEITFEQFTHALELLRGEKDLQDFYRNLGMDKPDKCLVKCKPFSKKNGSSLPQLPPIIRVKKTLNGSISSKIVPSENSKTSVSETRNRVLSKLPSAAIAIPRLTSRSGSYNSKYGQKKSDFRSWDEINKIDSVKLLNLYGDLQLNNLIIRDQSDDENLEKFGY